ncbi:MAG TPA: peptidyl-prolyl cis-trans isomerase, partial [Gammaproteobacteria bacterium]|nr:peptidyl-prolyl cis-trans isomerase [Gammaproteobacteria bacterium]
MPSSLFSSWLREPLIQFLLLALLMFALDSYVLGNRPDPRHIV